MELQGEKAIVTGGSGGFGAGIARALARWGAKVWITGRDEVALNRIADETGAVPVVADVTSGADWDRLFSLVGDDVGILVNNAGAGVRIAPLAEQSDSEIAAAVNVNLTGALMGCARAAERMRRLGRGAIVNISSVCALHAWPGWSVYTAAKAGLSKFSHALHTEMRPHGVRVFCLTPSWGSTGFNRAAGITGASEDPELALKCISPDEIGRLVVTLLETPDHLTVPDITLQPMIQDIQPM